MRVTYFIGSTTGGGAEHVMCELATYMSEHGHESTILTVTETEHSYPIGTRVHKATIDIKHRIPFAKSRLIIKMFKLFIFILKNKTDMYVVFLPETIKALMLFRPLIKVPIVVSERNNPSSYTEKTKKSMVSEFNKADGVVYQTENAKRFYAENNSGQKNVIIIPNAITGKLPEVYTGKRTNKIVSVGRFKEQKNFPLLIQAYAKVLSSFPDLQLVIYGEGELKKQYIKLCEVLNISDKVSFPGFVDNVTEKIKDASLFVLSSDYEGMPNALIEAMAVGLPCISTDCDGGGARFLIDSGKNGILVPVRNPDALAEGICSVISDNVYASKIGSEARKIRDKLSEENIYSVWMKYLESVVGVHV